MADVIWSPRANRHLHGILSVISREVGGAAALKWNRRFLKASRQLEKFPEIGSPVDDVPSPGLTHCDRTSFFITMEDPLLLA